MSSQVSLQSVKYYKEQTTVNNYIHLFFIHIRQVDYGDQCISLRPVAVNMSYKINITIKQRKKIKKILEITSKRVGYRKRIVR